ncbi:MAG: hypothetical protein ACK4MS_01715 [Paracoccaceae bacterium]
MNGASKILTVSYGTFSCTLEGFDDPFNTMKAIAEYFRDLAAEDRYFGAEPPQPDAAMLHRIAEREIQRRVEAKIQENGVILRAEDHGAIAAKVTAAPSSQEAVPHAPMVEMPARAATPVAKPTPTVTLGESGTESVAAKLSRLRKAASLHQDSVATDAVLTTSTALFADYDEDDIDVQNAQPLANTTAAADTDDHIDLPSHVADTEEDFPEVLAASAEEVVREDIVPEQQTAADDLADHIPDAEDLADLMRVDGASDDAPEQEAEPSVAGDEPLAATAVVSAESHAQVVADDADDQVERTAWQDADDSLLASIAAETATPEMDEPQDASSDDALLASLGSMIDPEDQFGSTQELASDTQSDDLEIDIDTVAAAVADDIETGTTIETVTTSDHGKTADTSDQLTDAPEGAVVAAAPEDFDTAEAAFEPQASADGVPDVEMEQQPVAPVRPTRPVRTIRPTLTESVTLAESPSVPLAAAPARATEGWAKTSENESRTPISVEKLQRARARVIKIRRADASASATTDTEIADSAPAPAVLSDEAEAALAAELAAVEQDAPKSDAGLAQRLGPTAEDAAVNRLMDEAGTQMEVPDTKRRMSAIAHLKAAVAATIAERRATGSTLASDNSERMGAYRDDLARTVRPSASTPLAPAERPAPLVLVSEQRIDRPVASSVHPSAVAPVQPVRPLRPLSQAATAIAAEMEMDDDFDLDEEAGNIFESETGFPEFAERLGATELRDLLEAAAAYIACVEGRDSFTRPQLMRYIAAATDTLSREDSLRSFGTLLREGVIERSRRGQFAISATSTLLSEAKKIAG